MRALLSRVAMTWAACLVALAVAEARADTLELSDGTVHRGKVLSATAETVGFKTEDGKVLVIKRSDVKTLTREAAPSTPKSEPATPKETPTAKPGKGDWKTRKISFDFVETPFRQVLEKIGESAGVNTVLDASVREGDLPNVTLRVASMEAQKALDWVCKLVGIKYYAKDDTILVGTPEVIRDLIEKTEPKVRRVHDLGILVDRKESEGKFTRTGESWKELIILSIAPGSWDPANGVSIEYRAGKLIVVHREEVQKEVSEWIRSHIEVTRREREKPGSIESKLPPLDPDGPMKGKKVTFDFAEVPIEQALARLKETSGVMLVLDTDVLKPTPPKPITLQGKDMPLKAAADAICGQTGLGYIFKDGAVFFSTKDRVKERFIVAMHYVQPALISGRGSDRGNALIEKLKQEVAPGTWGDGPGNASLWYGNNYLTVRHVLAVQWEVRRWLARQAAHVKR